MNAPIHYAWYDAAGRIVRIVFCLPAEREANAPAGLPYIESAAPIDARQQWVDGGELRPRPAQASRLDGMTLRDLPIPCEIVIDGTRYACADGIAELSFGQAGVHKVRVEAFPYQPAEFEVAS